ncbi:MAG: cytochrome C oxidase subunit IV family protein [Planctomycetota bacterium]
MSDHAHSHGHDDHGFAHVMPPRILVGVWLALISLTALTVWTASMHLHPFDLLIAMVIATIKGLLVALFFMHLKYDRPFNGLIFMMSFVFAGLFVMFAMFDTHRNQTAIAARGYDDPIKEAWREELQKAAEHAVVVDGEHGSAEHATEGNGAAGEQGASTPAENQGH